MISYDGKNELCSPIKSLFDLLTVNSNGLYSTITTLHEPSDYRERPTVTGILGTFEKAEVATPQWFFGRKNVFSAVTKQIISRHNILNRTYSAREIDSTLFSGSKLATFKYSWVVFPLAIEYFLSPKVDRSSILLDPSQEDHGRLEGIFYMPISTPSISIRLPQYLNTEIPHVPSQAGRWPEVMLVVLRNHTIISVTFLIRLFSHHVFENPRRLYDISFRKQAKFLYRYPVLPENLHFLIHFLKLHNC